MAGIYLRAVMNLLDLSESAINKLIAEGHINCIQSNPNAKRVFSEEEIQEFKQNSNVYRSLKKQKVIVYLRCTTQEQERQVRRKVESYCKQNKFKATIVSELDRGQQETSRESYKSAINYIFEQTGIAGLIYLGNTDDITDLKQIFQSKKGSFVYNANEPLTIYDK